MISEKSIEYSNKDLKDLKLTISKLSKNEHIEIYSDFGQLSHPGLRPQRDFSLCLLMELVLESLLDFVSLINEGVHCSLHSVLFTPVLQEVRKNIRRSFLTCDHDRSHCGS